MVGSAKEANESKRMEGSILTIDRGRSVAKLGEIVTKWAIGSLVFRQEIDPMNVLGSEDDIKKFNY